jgi:hypothetical protein
VNDSISHALNHELRRLLVESLWRSPSPLSVKCLHKRYVTDERVTLPMVVYHARELVRVGIVQVDKSDDAQQRLEFGGKNASEAVRRLGLSSTRGST